MKLFENPIFLTQQRLARRAGILALVLIALLVGLSLLAGLISALVYPNEFNFVEPQDAGRVFYGWIVGLEIAVLVLGGFNRISRVLGEDRKAGLWDSNRLTPMKPAELVNGYWFGAPLREFYMGLALALTGLPIVLLARLPVTLWLGTQILILATAIFFGLLAVLTGLAVQRPQNNAVVFLLLFFCQMPSLGVPSESVTNFLLPVYAVVNLFVGKGSPSPNPDWDWTRWPAVFGQPVPPLVLTLGLQAILGIVVWRAVVRRTANPFQSVLRRWEAMVTFGLLVVMQHGLMWGIWKGNFGAHYDDRHTDPPLLAIVHGGVLLMGVMILGFISPAPEQVRLDVLRAGGGGLSRVLARSAVPAAAALAVIGGLALLTQFTGSFGHAGGLWALAFGNLLAVFLMFALLLEFCRLRHKSRALGFMTLWLFILCFLPFVLGGVFSEGALARVSFLSPGVLALGNDLVRDDTFVHEQKFLAGALCGHLAIVILFFVLWCRQWKQFLRGNPPASSK